MINLILRTDLSPVVSEKYIPLVMILLGFLNIVLRKLTTTEMFKAK